jgi:DNA-binding NarL/FixJ family response regulator
MATVTTDFGFIPGQAKPGAVSASLTAREIEVLRLMADGLTTKDIAVRLDVSFKTAACHRYRVLQKLCCDTTVIAVRWAIRQGLVEP